MSKRELELDIKDKLSAFQRKRPTQLAVVEKTKPTDDCSMSFWKQFFDIESELNMELKPIKIPKIEYIYNPIEYASSVHCAYLQKFLDGPKKVMLIGMNPGPNGMAQNGVPFGNTRTVRQLMGLKGDVEQPLLIHPKRLITGLSCTTEEPSGVRIWNLIEQLSGGLEVFSRQCFVHNFCPLALFDSDGRNITPAELRGDAKENIRTICSKYLVKEIQLVHPEIIVSIGSYVGDCMKKLVKEHNYIDSNIKLLQLAHPSPRSLNNTNWPEKATRFFEENELIKYFRGEV